MVLHGVLDDPSRRQSRSELRNRTIQLAFRLLGSHTMCHVGTGDHLHVSLGRPAEPPGRARR